MLHQNKKQKLLTLKETSLKLQVSYKARTQVLLDNNSFYLFSRVHLILNEFTKRVSKKQISLTKSLNIRLLHSNSNSSSKKKSNIRIISITATAVLLINLNHFYLFKRIYYSNQDLEMDYYGNLSLIRSILLVIMKVRVRACQRERNQLKVRSYSVQYRFRK